MRYLYALSLIVLSTFLYSQDDIVIVPPHDTTVYCSDGNVYAAIYQWIDNYENNSSNFNLRCPNGELAVIGAIDDDTEWAYILQNRPSICGVYEFYFFVEEFDDADCSYYDYENFAFLTIVDTIGPSLNSSQPIVKYVTCDSPSANFDLWTDEVYQAFGDECTDYADLDITHACLTSPCDATCNDSIAVEFMAIDKCNNVNTLILSLVINNDPDEDGIDTDSDNCPTLYNPGQEDIDEDGIGNLCDNQNEVDGIASFADHLYIDKEYSGIIMKAQNGKCWAITVNNDGSLSSVSVDCPD